MKCNLAKISLRLVIIYAILLCVFTACIVAAFAIPTDSIKHNVQRSARQIESEGLWFQPLGFYLFQIDNMTDCLMMNISVCADSQHPVKSAMMANYAQPYDKGDVKAYHNIASTTLDVSLKGCDDSTIISSYARYWHGYQIVLRPLLYFLYYNQIRILNYVALFILLSAATVLLYRVLGMKYAVTFLATLIASNIMIVPLAIQFSTCFYIVSLCMIVLLRRPKTATNRSKSIMLFFITGAVTSYMDFLTTPLLTLGFPLVVLIAMNKHNERIKTILIQSAAWGGGYASLWISKWIVGTVITGENIFNSAFGCAQQRVGDTIVFGGVEMPMSHFFDIIITKVSSIINPLWIVAIICVMAALVIFYLYKERKRLRTEGWLMLIAMMPLLWFIVMKNHSLQHIFFTWRDWMLTLWCLLLFICHNNNKITERQ